MKENEFKCSQCLEIFEKGWTDEEAEEEKKKIWGEDFSPSEMCLVCDDCFKLLCQN